MFKPKKYRLDNKVAWLTGAASGLGKALAVELDREKMSLVLIDKDKDQLAELMRHLAGNNRHAIICIDLADHEGIIRGLNFLGDSHKDVDVLINCAGFVAAGYFEDIPYEEFKHSINVNFDAPLILMQNAIKIMKNKKEGQIVNITSAMGRRAVPFFSPYCVAKASLNALTDSIRAELAAYNINVMLVSPGPMATNIFPHALIYGNVKIKKIKFPKMRAPEITARRIVRGLKRRSSRIIQFSAVEILILINFFSPAVVDRLFKKTILDKIQK